jgi:tryptophanyl-tRNA synthetase
MSKEQKSRSLTGDRPTGKLHLGHFVGSLQNRLVLQDTHDSFVMIADVQGLSANADNPQKIRDNVLEVALDYLAVGLDPKKTTIFIQSLIPEIAELTVYFLNLVTIARLGQNPTVKTEMKEKGFENSVPAGFYMHPINQAADILAFRADVVPVGEDQLPMIEQTNEIVEKFNRLYGETFNKVKAMTSKTPRLPGIDGMAKMSKSLGNAIYLSDTKKEIEKKVMEMYTDPEHIKATDPGHVDGNVVFMYLDAFDSDHEEVAKLKHQYSQGGLGDVMLKKRLIEILDDLLAPMRERRAEFEKNPKEVMKILEEGTKKARATTTATLTDVRRAMKIDYFS